MKTLILLAALSILGCKKPTQIVSVPTQQAPRPIFVDAPKPVVIAPTTVLVRDEDNGRTVNISNGGELVIALSEPADRSKKWVPVALSTSIGKLEDESIKGVNQYVQHRIFHYRVNNSATIAFLLQDWKTPPTISGNMTFKTSVN